jgi:hypothetical protein
LGFRGKPIKWPLPHMFGAQTGYTDAAWALFSGPNSGESRRRGAEVPALRACTLCPGGLVHQRYQHLFVPDLYIEDLCLSAETFYASVSVISQTAEGPPCVHLSTNWMTASGWS